MLQLIGESGHQSHWSIGANLRIGPATQTHETNQTPYKGQLA